MKSTANLIMSVFAILLVLSVLFGAKSIPFTLFLIALLVFGSKRKK